MKRIKRFESFLEESYLSGSHAPLYHTTGIEFASQILNTDSLITTKSIRGQGSNSISFTRDKDFVFENYPVTFIVDQSKLKQTHKIQPFDYLSILRKMDIDAETTDTRKFKREVPDLEFEDRVEGSISNLHNYIISIRLNSDLESYKNTKPNTREQFRESYEDLIMALIDYNNKYGTKIVDHNGKEVDIEALKKESETFVTLAEGIYNKNSGTRIFYTKAADEDSYRVYYSSYKPIVGDTPDDFMKFLKGTGIEHVRLGGNSVKMNKAGINRLKKSMLNLDEAEDKKTIKFDILFHGGDIDFNKPMYFSDNELVARSYGNVSNYKIELMNPVLLDFSAAEGWWLPEISAKEEVKKLGMKLEDFDKYKDNKEIRSVKTDHFIKAAKEKGFDGVIFKNIMDAGSLPVKGDKFIRTTNVAVIYPKKSIKKI